MPQPDENEDYEYEDNEGAEAEDKGNGGTGQPLTPQADIVYNNTEEDIKRDEMANLFFTLATQINNSDKTITEFMKNTVTIKQKRYFRMSVIEETDFLEGLKTVNQNLGKAQTMLDTYMELEKSQPEFKNFYNKFYSIYQTINEHRKGLFYNTNAVNEEYLYPLVELVTEFGGLSFLLSRLSGVLVTCGNYLKHVVYLTPRSMGAPGEGGYPPGYSGGGYYPQSFPPSLRPGYDDSIYGGRNRKPEMRDIGDPLDTNRG